MSPISCTELQHQAHVSRFLAEAIGHQCSAAALCEDVCNMVSSSAWAFTPSHSNSDRGAHRHTSVYALVTLLQLLAAGEIFLRRPPPPPPRARASLWRSTRRMIRGCWPATRRAPESLSELFNYSLFLF